MFLCRVDLGEWRQWLLFLGVQKHLSKGQDSRRASLLLASLFSPGCLWRVHRLPFCRAAKRLHPLGGGNWDRWTKPEGGSERQSRGLARWGGTVREKDWDGLCCNRMAFPFRNIDGYLCFGFFFFNLSCSHALAIIPAALPLAGITVSSLLTAVLGGDWKRWWEMARSGWHRDRPHQSFLQSSYAAPRSTRCEWEVIVVFVKKWEGVSPSPLDFRC